MLTVIRNGTDSNSEIATGTFSGTAWRDILMAPQDGVSVGNVFFEPCSRTYWHSHVGGQLLVVLGGEVLIGDESGTEKLYVGDMVWTPPDTRHWHGASENRYGIHTAITVGATNWEEPVSDAQYRD